MTAPKRYMVTSALPYANGPLHIGHIAGAMLPADIYVRHLRSAGEDVAFVCGSDEHGAAITLRAKKEGVTPKDIVDQYHELMKKTFAEFGIEFDIYDRTSSPEHHKNAQDFFLTLLEKGSFEVKTEEQYFDHEAQQFLADRYITGTCPKCGHDHAYGDQCENCGSALSPTDLIDPRSVLSGSKPELKETSLWYLPMGDHEDWLRDYIENGQFEGKSQHEVKEWKKHVIGQCKSWIDSGLQSRAMTRDLDWGVPVPVEGADGKVLYVWLDAPIGYITATQKWAKEHGKNWEDYWKSEDSHLVHFIGKDNIVFHCLIFPILLREHGDYVLPYNVPANEFMNLEGDKISTSRNWAVWLHEYLEEFPGKQDELRYVLASIMPEQKDSEFTWNDYKDRVNNELADILGNFINRAVVLTHKYYDGAVPAAGELLPQDEEMLQTIAATPEKVAKLIRGYRFREAQLEAMNLARAGNKYLTEEEPWKKIKEDPERVKTIMNICVQVAANLPYVLHPFLPNTSAKIASALGLNHLEWNEAGKSLLEPGTSIEKTPILFTKVDDELVSAQVAKLEEAKAASQERELEPVKANVPFEQFAGLDIRIAEILDAEPIKKTKKLLKLTIRTGVDERTVVSGIAEHYKPEEIIGKKVCVLLNLEPRKIKGVESQGMVLMAENAAGELSFVTAEKGAEPGDGVA
ncbi:methionine--tRNA ligase [Sanyastnella coralliicola]|uniref:methionine--tRNA ligase n=1 Tax=Sanyastnella coralliicola TaxID=3069118 RepID=UPI0027BAEDB8|nr:methionine--tRNA ligase [Longitalea sp. SCSIO 12813]